MDSERLNALINRIEHYLDRAARLRKSLESVDDPVARALLETLIEAYEEAAAEADDSADRKFDPKDEIIVPLRFHSSERLDAIRRNGPHAIA
jgi:hypothetical protein